MVEIEAVLDKDGVLRSCKACGHAGAGPAGADIVCAAVSILIWTAACTLSYKDGNGVTFRYNAPEPGLFSLEADYTAEGKEFLFAAGVFLVEGFGFLAEEYPDHCRLTLRRV